MPKLAIRKQGPGFVPATQAAAREFDKIKPGITLKADIRQERSGPHHRYYWALCTLLADALNAGPGDIEWDQEMVSDRLKIATGRVHAVDLPPSMARKYGTPVAVKPASISFAKMEQSEFSRFVDAAVSYIVVEFGEWIMEAPEWAQVQDILAQSKVPA